MEEITHINFRNFNNLLYSKFEEAKMKLNQETKIFFENHNAIELLNKMADGIISELYPNIHINIDLSSFENALKQHKFSTEGKFHFLAALKLNYPNITNNEKLNAFIAEIRGHYQNNDLTEESYEKIIKQLLVWFEDELTLKEIHSHLFSTKYDDKFIEDYKIIFLFFEYCYKSSALSEVYGFDKVDARRQLFHRLEYISYSFLQQSKIFSKDITNEIIQRLKYNFTIEECIEYVKFKETEFRRVFVNELFFNVEHFLSTIRKHYKIKEGLNIDKKNLLKEVLNHLDIDINIELDEIKKSVRNRCNESSDEILQIFEGRNIKKDFLFYHNIILQIRNSLHSNGKTSKSMSAIRFGKVYFDRLVKDEFHKSMSVSHLVVLALIEVIAIEKIIKETKDEDIIEDEYMIDLFKPKNKEQS
jgi:hypothetical protein